jgi:5-methylcytosine-specific restriction enzyme A
MTARWRQQRDEARRAAESETAPVVCGLCERSIPPSAKSSLHHLTPRLKGGTHLGTVRLHQICHSAIHARFSEAEIAKRLNDLDMLRADPELARFIAWVKTKPNDFHAPTRMTRERRASKRAH